MQAVARQWACTTIAHAPSHIRGCLWACCWWQTFTLFSVLPAAWIYPYSLGSPSGAAATSLCCLLGPREGAWNLLWVACICPVICTNRGQLLCLSLFTHSIPFRQILHSDRDAEQPHFPFPSQLFVPVSFQGTDLP